MKKTRVLVVEDEPIIALSINQSLKESGFEITDIAKNCDEALSSIRENEPDVILMDINLENSKDGIEIVKDIQKIRNIPVIYLTAYSDDETIGRAIETNPVGYLLKPFKSVDIKSTILLSMYKLNQTTQAIIENNTNLGGGYSYNLKHKNLYYKQIPIKLTIKEAMLLFILIEAKGSIISFDELGHQLWPNSVVTASALRTLIYRLRTKLEFKLIDTIPSFGCRLTTVF